MEAIDRFKNMQVKVEQIALHLRTSGSVMAQAEVNRRDLSALDSQYVLNSQVMAKEFGMTDGMVDSYVQEGRYAFLAAMPV